MSSAPLAVSINDVMPSVVTVAETRPFDSVTAPPDCETETPFDGAVMLPRSWVA